MQRGSAKNRLMDRWLGVPVLHAFSRTRRRRPLPDLRRTARLGVMCSPALGDTLLFSAVLADLRAQLPAAAEIVHFCFRSNLHAAEAIAGADRRVLLDLTRPPASLRILRAERVEAMLDFSAWQRLTALLTWGSGAGFAAGFDTPGQFRGRAFDLAVPHSRALHELDNFRALVRAVGLRAGAPPAVHIAPPAAEPLPDEGDLVVLHPWASGQRSHLREWPEARWVELAGRLAKPGTLYVVTGAPADLPRMEPFAARLEAAGLRAVALPGTDGFRTLTAVLRRARLAVSVNTGVMHLAAILGTPTLALNGPTAGHRWGPVGRLVAGVTPADGSGGYLHLGFEFAGQPEDIMSRIPVEQVVAAAQELLQRAAAAAEPAPAER